MMKIQDTAIAKRLRSDAYNFNFSKVDGTFMRWGKTYQDDPDWSPFGPEIADIEISSAASSDIDDATHDKNKSTLTIVTPGGCSGLGCKKFCYKQNTSDTTIHMSVDLFRQIMDRMPSTLTQIAFGICSIDGHPQLFDIFDECKKRGVVANITVNGVGITSAIATKLAKSCGAIAVSVNPQNKEIAYNAIKLLSQDNQMTQINIHIVLAEETVDFVKSVVDDMKSNQLLSKMNAMVMLSFKDKGKTACFSPITLKSYIQVIEYCDKARIRYGFDSCSAHTYLKAIANKPNFEQLSVCAEPCESGLFSIYINVFGYIYACSFCEGVGSWQSGINVLDYKSLLEAWNSSQMQSWRKQLLSTNRKCPFYKIGV